MLQPKRTKFRKAHKGRIHGMAKGGVSLNFGSYGLKATRPERVTARQIESARRAITRHLKRTGRLSRRKSKLLCCGCTPQIPQSWQSVAFSINWDWF